MSTTDDRARGITLIGASAGTGKTHRLTKELADGVDPAHPTPVAPESLVAVTYTHKAAMELASRLRSRLIGAGEFDRAQRLPLAYLGTVHAVCLRWIQEYAFEAGLAPQVDVLAGDERRLLREALEQSLPPELRERIEALAHRFELHRDARVERTNWLMDVEDIMTLARSNRIEPADLRAMAERSADDLLDLMGPQVSNGDQLDADLVRAMECAITELRRVDTGQQNTERARRDLEDLLRKARAGGLHWSDWIRLQGLSPGKKLEHLTEPVEAVARQVDSHPRLQAEVRELIRALHEAARGGLDAYDAWKRRLRVVDFVDMIDRALTLLKRPDVSAELGERLRWVAVDEFQDTSPVQLELFVHLHVIAGRSTWVGDRKQCIFEYAGADPGLMDAVTRWVHASGGSTDQLPENRRSRPELVAACSRLFSAAFAQDGYDAGEVEVRSTRATPPRLEALPPIGVWTLQTSKNEEDAQAIAEGIRRLLENPVVTPVVDPTTKEERDLRASDVAILVATNDEACRIATALGHRGIGATVARQGLLATPEGTLVRALLGALLDPRDTLSRATVDALLGFEGNGPDTWLDSQIARAARDEHSERRNDVTARDKRLERLAAELFALSPSEIVDRVLGAFDVAGTCRRWPVPDQRLGNLDALRGLAVSYERRCEHAREVATLAGLLRYFDEATERVFVRDEERASDEQHVGGGDNAVVITTYHRAKGLEWPVVVLGSLDRPPRRGAFEVSPESDRDTFDPANPLAGRWIRTWPWPYGLRTSCRLAETVEQSPMGKAVSLRERRERARLLYVGFTRACDHLILATRVKNDLRKARWLDELADRAGRPVVDLPEIETGERVDIGIRGRDGSTDRVRARHWRLDAAAPTTRRASREDGRWPARAAAAAGSCSFRIAPSQAVKDWPDLVLPSVGEPELIGQRLPLGRADASWEVVGDAVHGFLAADTPELSRDERLARAERLLAAWDLSGTLAPEALLCAGDQLRAWVDRRWPGATWHRELPISASLETPQGIRRVEGTIDLLLETAAGAVIVDHKAFPGGRKAWAEKAREHAPQVQAYARVVEAAGIRVVGKWLHFTIAGSAVPLL